MSKTYYSTKGLTGLLGDVRRQNNFRVTINDITGDNSLELIMQNAFLPKVSLQPIELRHGNDAIKLAGLATWEGGTITILDVLSRKELDTLLAWFNQTYNTKTGAIGFAEDVPGTGIKGYKKNGTITEYASDGRLARKWTVQGMWISSPDLGVLDATSGSHKEISFAIQIDRSELVPEYEDDEQF